MKIIYFDTETTGLDHTMHDIVQFAAIIEIDGEVVEEINWHCQPTRWVTVDAKALEVQGRTLEELNSFESPIVMANKLKALFDKHIDKYDKNDKFYPAGQNVSFDLDFLQAFWKQHIDGYGIGSYQNWRAIDSRIFANFLMAAGKLDLPDVHLSTLCEHFEIELDAHDALNDIRATRQLIKKMMSLIV